MANHILITVPRKIKWDDYEKELERAKNGETMRFKVPQFPSEIEIGESRCYVLHNGIVKGWMLISGLSKGRFKCSTTGTIWEGKFIDRTGEFHATNIAGQKGFQGWRYFHPPKRVSGDIDKIGGN